MLDVLIIGQEVREKLNRQLGVEWCSFFFLHITVIWLCDVVLCCCIEQIQRKWKTIHSCEYAAFRMIRGAHFFSATWLITVQWRFNVPSSVAVMLMSLVSIMKLELCLSYSFSIHGVGNMLPAEVVLINPYFFLDIPCSIISIYILM